MCACLERQEGWGSNYLLLLNASDYRVINPMMDRYGHVCPPRILLFLSASDYRVINYKSFSLMNEHSIKCEPILN